MPNFLINNHEKLLVEVYPGKDNQSGQKGQTCSFYAEKYVRSRAFQGASLKHHSHIRQCMTRTNDVYSELAEIIDDCAPSRDLKTYLEKSYAYLVEIETTTLRHEKHLADVRQELKLLLETFHDGFKNNTLEVHKVRLKTWLKERVCQKQIDAIQTLSDSSISQRLGLPPELSSNEKRAIYELFWHKRRRDDYGIMAAKWHPRDGFSALLEEVERVGPLLAVGHFGQRFHKTKPLCIEKTTNYALHSFPEDSYTDEQAMILHSVVLVGGDKKKECIYYIDPYYEYHVAKPMKLFRLHYHLFVQRYTNPYGNIDANLESWGIASGAYLLKKAIFKFSIFAIKHYQETEPWSERKTEEGLRIK